MRETTFESCPGNPCVRVIRATGKRLGTVHVEKRGRDAGESWQFKSEIKGLRDFKGRTADEVWAHILIWKSGRES